MRVSHRPKCQPTASRLCEDWIHQIARNDDLDLNLVTMFVPLFRVERIFLDDPSGMIKSHGQRFEEVVGIPIATFLGLDEQYDH